MIPSTFIVVPLLLFLASKTHGQGVVTFQNASSAAGWAPMMDRNVKWGSNLFNIPIGANVSSNYAGVNLARFRAQLFYGGLGAAPEQMIPVQTAPATFKQSTSSSAGSWYGGTRTLDGFNHGDQVALQVRVWDTAITTNAAEVRRIVGTIFYGGTNGGHYGESKIFNYSIPDVNDAPLLRLMNNLNSFAVVHFPLNTNASPQFWIICQQPPMAVTNDSGSNTSGAR